LDILQKGLALMLITDLSKVKEIQLVERIKVQALVEELDLGVAGLVESETVFRVGRLLGVEHLIGGEIIKEEIDQFALTSSLLKVQFEEVSGYAMAKGELLAELFRMEKDILFEIINKLQIELSPELEAELSEFLTTDLNALLYLFEGSEQSDLGNYKKAAEYYEKALNEDPGLSYADDLIFELEDLDLWRTEADAYSRLERVISIAETNVSERVDDRDRPERENSPSVKGYGSIDLSWEFASSDVAAEKSGLNRAIEMAVDPEAEEIFLAYAVQVEKDRLNTRILEMHQEAVKDRIRLDTINTALKHAELRIRDDWFTQNADARSGRVLKDEKGNWVRVQQYILRPDDKTVQVLNVCLRGGSGDLAGLSVMDFTTQFKDSLPAGRDLRSLPWNKWLETRSAQAEGRYVHSPEYKGYEQVNPQLDSMYVKFTNAGNESLKESRGFDIRSNDVQYIISEQLTINNSPKPYDFTTGSPGSAQYAVMPNAGNGNNPRGFDYVLGDGNTIETAFYVVGDGDRDNNQGISEVDYSNIEFNDIWDALRVNEGYVTGDAGIGNNNLEIAIDAEKNLFAKPIDLIYIPMSRMLWKNNGS
jgi:tetratricopeptide (TPR) repeat protein